MATMTKARATTIGEFFEVIGGQAPEKVPRQKRFLEPLIPGTVDSVQKPLIRLPLG